jgi:hypothetical protein
MGMLVDNERLNEFRPLIATLPVSDKFTRDQLLNDRFCLYSDGRLAIYYAPFDYSNSDARVAIVGITPGWTQMELAYRVFRHGLEQGKTFEEICSDIEHTASFAGSLRTNLVRMLDQLGLPDVLEIHSSAELFGVRDNLVHTTSALRYPVFVNGENYTGYTPAILKHPQLKSYVDTLLVEELRAASSALVVPLGKAVSRVLEYLVYAGLLEAERCLLNFPHPSGANGHRKRHFEANKAALRGTVMRWYETSS